MIDMPDGATWRNRGLDPGDGRCLATVPEDTDFNSISAPPPRSTLTAWCGTTSRDRMSQADIQVNLVQEAREAQSHDIAKAIDRRSRKRPMPWGPDQGGRGPAGAAGSLYSGG